MASRPRGRAPNDEDGSPKIWTNGEWRSASEDVCKKPQQSASAKRPRGRAPNDKDGNPKIWTNGEWRSARYEDEQEEEKAHDLVSEAEGLQLHMATRNNSSSGYCGVSTRACGRFEARHGKERLYLGLFDTAVEAAVAYARHAKSQEEGDDGNGQDEEEAQDEEELPTEAGGFQLKLSVRSNSGYSGVYEREPGRFEASYFVDSKRTCLGVYDIAVQAAVAVARAQAAADGDAAPNDEAGTEEEGPPRKRLRTDEFLLQRVELDWKDGRWFAGSVVDYSSATGEYLVRFDDGEQAWYDLEAEMRDGTMRREGAAGMARPREGVAGMAGPAVEAAAAPSKAGPSEAAEEEAEEVAEEVVQHEGTKTSGRRMEVDVDHAAPEEKEESSADEMAVQPEEEEAEGEDEEEISIHAAARTSYPTAHDPAEVVKRAAGHVARAPPKHERTGAASAASGPTASPPFVQAMAGSAARPPSTAPAASPPLEAAAAVTAPNPTAKPAVPWRAHLDAIKGDLGIASETGAMAAITQALREYDLSPKAAEESLPAAVARCVAGSGIAV